MKETLLLSRSKDAVSTSSILGCLAYPQPIRSRSPCKFACGAAASELSLPTTQTQRIVFAHEAIVASVFIA